MLGIGVNIQKQDSVTLVLSALKVWLLTETGVPENRTSYIWVDEEVWDDNLIWTE